MSPLVRPLLVLATAALFATVHTQDDPIRRRMFSGFGGKPAACVELTKGAMPDKNPYIRKIELKRMHDDPAKNSTHKFEINIPNEAKTDEALVGQRVLVCDFKNPKNSLDLNSHLADQYTPLNVTCKNGCPDGVEVIADQFVIHKLS